MVSYGPTFDSYLETGDGSPFQPRKEIICHVRQEEQVRRGSTTSCCAASIDRTFSRKTTPRSAELPGRRSAAAANPETENRPLFHAVRNETQSALKGLSQNACRSGGR